MEKSSIFSTLRFILSFGNGSGSRVSWKIEDELRFVNEIHCTYHLV